MQLELQTAIISALIALVTAGIDGYFTWSQVRREKTRWLIDLKASYSVELYTHGCTHQVTYCSSRTRAV